MSARTQSAAFYSSHSGQSPLVLNHIEPHYEDKVGSVPRSPAVSLRSPRTPFLASDRHFPEYATTQELTIFFEHQNFVMLLARGYLSTILRARRVVSALETA